MLPLTRRVEGRRNCSDEVTGQRNTASQNIAVKLHYPLPRARTRLFDQMTQEHIDFMLAKIPRGRFVGVEEIGAMVAWLVSEENSFTTGAVF